MEHDIEQKLLREIEELKKKIRLLEGKDETGASTYQYSKIRDSDLLKLFDIEQNLDERRFDGWFRQTVETAHEDEHFLAALLEDNRLLIERYGEEDLKANFIVPLLNRVRFKSFERKVRDFYELPLRYATEKFIFSGTVDFAVSKGLVESRKPYFFIQEFKRSEDYGNPRPQLLAELISAVELNAWTEMKGAYIIGGSWHFVILEKLAQEKYQYFISQNFDSTKLNDLLSIYRNLVIVKHEIFRMIK